MKILVTGSSGTIGTRLCEKLLDQGNDLVALDREPNKWQSSIDALTHHIELLHPKKLEELPKNIDTIVHLAANARVYELVEHPDRALENIVTTFNVLEFARKRGIKKFLFASSRETYGNIDVERYTEDLPRLSNCESPYTASKMAGEALVESYYRCYKLDHVTFRFSNVYGMYDDSVRVVPLFIRQARANEALTIFGEEKCLDFTYIDDAVEGILLALQKFETVKNNVYNIATGEGTTILRLAERIRDLTKSSSKITLGTPRTGEVLRYIADISKAKRALDYSPQTPFKEGIERAVEWYRSIL